jgi:hypothetical protein
MPLLNPLPPTTIQEVLRTVRKETAKNTLKEILDDRLPADEIIENIAAILRDSTNDPTRLRAAELAGKLHGFLNGDETRQAPVINIYINGNADINPILIPREYST